MNSFEYATYNGLEIIGKEYIAKCSGIVKITDNFVHYVADSIFVIKSTMNLIKPELEDIENDTINKELLTFLDVIKEKFNEISRISKETKIKLLQISHISFSSKADQKSRVAHAELYRNFHAKTVELIENFIKDIVDPSFDLIKEFGKLITNKAPIDRCLQWHATIFRSLKESLRYLKMAVKNNNVINNHIDEYRKNLINQIKISQILDEAKKIRPIGLMRTSGKIKTKEIAPGSIYSHSLYTDDSDLIKESFVPFMEKDIEKLKADNIQYLYKHNNIDKHLKPTDYHIAIVDDDKSFTDLIEEQLKSLQFNVDVYNSAEKALKDIKTTLPDVILLDIKMPGINGIDFLGEMHKKINNGKISFAIPVIMTSGFINERLVRECIKRGAYDYIVKPFTIEDLLVKITSYLHIKKH